MITNSRFFNKTISKFEKLLCFSSSYITSFRLHKYKFTNACHNKFCSTVSFFLDHSYLTNLTAFIYNSGLFFIIWEGLKSISLANNLEFKISEFVVDFFYKWIPFLKGFFFFKTTRTNIFFFFCALIPKVDLFTYIYQYFLSLEGSNNSVYDHVLFMRDCLSDTDLYKFELLHYRSAGCFGLKKKERRSFFIVPHINDFLNLKLNSFIYTYQIDYFYIYINGLFKYFSYIYHTIKSIFYMSMYQIKDSFEALSISKDELYSSHFGVSNKVETPELLKEKAIKLNTLLGKFSFFCKLVAFYEWVIEFVELVDNHSIIGNIETSSYFIISNDYLNDKDSLFFFFPFLILKVNSFFRNDAVINSKLEKYKTTIKHSSSTKIIYNRVKVANNRYIIPYINNTIDSTKLLISIMYKSIAIYLDISINEISNYLHYSTIQQFFFLNLLKLPRAFFVMDYTSYPFNGCKRTIHYKV